jgi:hypothetical protein
MFGTTIVSFRSLKKSIDPGSSRERASPKPWSADASLYCMSTTTSARRSRSIRTGGMYVRASEKNARSVIVVT